MTNDLRYWLGFDHIVGFGPVTRSKLTSAFESMAQAWTASLPELLDAGLSKKVAASVIGQRERIDLNGLMRDLQRAEVTALHLGSPGYPTRLRDIDDPPAVLYVKGELTDGDLDGITVIGTKDCTRYGLETGRLLAEGLSRRGVTVISDLVRGIDLEANRSALQAGGRTVAVLASGVDRVPAPRARAVADDIVSAGAGCLVSEYPLGAKTYRGQLRRRNRLLSGLGRGVLVIEAPKKSGTMLTVQCALEQGRPVFAVPGKANSPQSEGTNWLLHKGAKFVTGVGDILEDLEGIDYAETGRDNGATAIRLEESSRGEVGPRRTRRRVSERREPEPIVVENEEERRIVVALNGASGPLTADDLSIETQISVDKLGATLGMMEIRGCVRSVGAGYLLPSTGQRVIAPLLLDSNSA